jgi:hypothetical protein
MDNVRMLVLGAEDEAAPGPTQSAGADYIVRASGHVNGVVHEYILDGAVLGENWNSGGADDRWCKGFTLNTADAKRARSRRPFDEEGNVSDATSLCPPVYDIDVLGSGRIELAAQQENFVRDEVEDDGAADGHRDSVDGVNGFKEGGVVEARAYDARDGLNILPKHSFEDTEPRDDDDEVTRVQRGGVTPPEGEGTTCKGIGVAKAQGERKESGTESLGDRLLQEGGDAVVPDIRGDPRVELGLTQ